ncbi:hypothetical protein KUCAC02_027260, partial [Chaenocephalus aceratus]
LPSAACSSEKRDSGEAVKGKKGGVREWEEGRSSRYDRDLGEGEEEQGEPRAGGGQLSQLRASLAEGSLTNFKSLLMSAHRRCVTVKRHCRRNGRTPSGGMQQLLWPSPHGGSLDQQNLIQNRTGGEETDSKRWNMRVGIIHTDGKRCSLPNGRALFEHRPITSQHVPAPCKLINIPPVFGPLHHPLGDQPSPGPSYGQEPLLQ